jgi:signal transduction histidine kinase
VVGHRDLLGKRFLDALPELKAIHFKEILDHVYQTGEPYIAKEKKFSLKRNPKASLEEIYLDVTCQRVMNGSRRPYGIFFHAVDVTDKAVSRDIRERFVATLSHDLRNPLSAARTGIQLILKYSDRAESREKLIPRILTSLERADQMIQDLLDANRIKAGEKLSIQASECDLHSIVSDALEELSLVYGDRFLFHSPKSVCGYWSCNDLRRVIENLCTNAVKYGFPDAKITITLKPEKERVLLCVHNFGPVIPKEKQAKLFEPFQRSLDAQKSDRRGWGLGLALVCGIAEAHGGDVKVDSNREDGTTFTVYLPWDAS